MKKLLVLNMLALLSFTFVNTYAQDKPKKKGGFFKEIFDELKEDLMGTPGAIDKNNINKYYNAFANKESNDSTIQSMVTDSAKHIAFTSGLSYYDPINGGFYVTQGLHNPPELRASSGTYYFYFQNMADYRFLKMSDKDIKEEFRGTSGNVNVGEVKKGMDNIEVYSYFMVDTAYTNIHGAKIIVANVHKVKVKWRYAEHSSNEIAVIEEPVSNAPIPYTRTIENTTLYGLYKEYPFYKDEDWPKVAITFTNFPKIYSEELYFMADPNVGQFDQFLSYPIISLKATIWEDKNTKIEIPEFTYLPCDFNTFGIPTANVVMWGLGSAQAIMKENTGYERTNGPIPPQHYLPQAPYEHKTYFENASPGIAVVSDILNKIGYDWSKKGDRRVWFNIEQ
ncbi:MAG: hypothetical protein GVY19_00020 [Bacteroidetes bacterium]|jgi:hypothetical protein|nr:hypothetical protein [Bacteroidota bacterium]